MCTWFTHRKATDIRNNWIYLFLAKKTFQSIILNFKKRKKRKMKQKKPNSCKVILRISVSAKIFLGHFSFRK